MCDYAVLVAEQAKVFLGGPPLVKMATGEDADDEELGGAAMHSQVSGLGTTSRSTSWTRSGSGARSSPTSTGASSAGAQPTRRRAVLRPEELLGIVSVDLRVPFDPREVIARVVDGSRFDEYKPSYGASLVTGWASIHGYPVGILANAQGVLFMDESKKATEFILLANQSETPLVFLQNTTGYMVGRHYEQAGMVKDGAKMINAVTNSRVPHLTVIMGSSYGAGNYGMCGRAYGPRFLFAWPNSKLAVMGPSSWPGAVDRGPPGRRGGRTGVRRGGRRGQRAAVEAQIERESHAFFNTGKLYDDGIIDRERPAPCWASPSRPSTPTWSRAPGASASSGCRRMAPFHRLLVANRGRSPAGSCARRGR